MLFSTGTEEHRLRHAAQIGGGNTMMDHAVHVPPTDGKLLPGRPHQVSMHAMHTIQCNACHHAKCEGIYIWLV